MKTLLGANRELSGSSSQLWVFVSAGGSDWEATRLIGVHCVFGRVEHPEVKVFEFYSWRWLGVSLHLEHCIFIRHFR